MKIYNFFKLLYCFLLCLFYKYTTKIVNNKILFTSHHGIEYSCNPMYISEYLQKNYPNKFEIFWAFKEPNNFEFLEKNGIKLVKINSKNYLKTLMSAKIIVTNVDEKIYFMPRKEQLVINTWHGGGSYKSVGFAHPLQKSIKTFFKQIRLKIIYSKYNLYLSSSKAFSAETIRMARLYKGEILEIGMPRNDILLNCDKNEINKKVRDFFGLDDERKIALYAPTWRSKIEENEREEIDYEMLKNTLSARFGGAWVVLARKHHNTKELNAQKGSLNGANYPRVQELLVAADVLISDYSSCIWDFSLSFKPIFLFCSDLEIYTKKHEFFSPIATWPGILATSNEELKSRILEFNENSFAQKIADHHATLQNCESGNATRIICERIVKESIL